LGGQQFWVAQRFWVAQPFSAAITAFVLNGGFSR